MNYKHDYDKILTRLTNILSRLNDGEALSVKALADEFNVSTKTIQRDFNERLIAFPIFQENKKWQMQEGFKLEKSTSIEETIILEIIEKMSENIGGQFFSKTKKLLQKIKNDDYNPFYTKLNLEDISDKFEEIQKLEIAIKSKKSIMCQYTINDTIKIKINPLKIVNYEGFWYLVAIDTKHNTLKKYYMKNISVIKSTDESFQITQKIDDLLENSISIWFQEDIEPFEVKLFIDSTITKYFHRKPISKTQIIEKEYANGNLEIKLMITHEMEILPLIKYWLPYIKIIEPIWLSDILHEQINLYYKDK
ncbi:MAG: helix-turn-helix transcriptional regulator [Arcobacteraceae bacterium]